MSNPNELYITILRILREAKKELYLVSPFTRFENYDSSLKVIKDNIIKTRN